MGLASVTTVNRRHPLSKLQPGFNDEAFDRAVASYSQDDLINVSHDEARTRRMLSAFQHNGDVIYLGNGWTPDIHQWPDSKSLCIPRCCEEKGINICNCNIILSNNNLASNDYMYIRCMKLCTIFLCPKS